MDDKLKKALEFSNYMITLDNQKRVLKEKYENDLIFFTNGGQFTITRELISFCQSLMLLKQDETVLIDDNTIPIEIDDLADFTNKIVNQYFSVTNNYCSEYNKLKTARSIKGLIN